MPPGSYIFVPKGTQHFAVARGNVVQVHGIGPFKAVFGRSAAGSSPVSDAERNREVVRRHLELINRAEWRQAADSFAEDVQHHRGNWPQGTAAIVKGRAVLAANLEDIFRTFPDWKMEILEMAVDGESVVVRCRVSGTHKGVATRPVNGALLVNAQPTGRRFEVQHIHWYKIRDGRIAEHATNRDDLGMLQQLGVLTPQK